MVKGKISEEERKMNKRKIALLVDVDNVKISKEAMLELFDKLEEMGDVVFCKFYGYNDRKHLYLSDIIAKYGYETAPFMRLKKRFSQLDNRIVVDAIKLVYTKPEINTFCIVAGDGDLSYTLAELRSHDKYLIDINSEHAEVNEHMFDEHVVLKNINAPVETYKPKSKKTVSIPKIKKTTTKTEKVEKTVPVTQQEPEDLEAYIEDEYVEDKEGGFDGTLSDILSDITARTSALDFSTKDDMEEKEKLIRDIEHLLSIQYAKGQGTNSPNEDIRQIFEELEDLVKDMKSAL